MSRNLGVALAVLLGGTAAYVSLAAPPAPADDRMTRVEAAKFVSLRPDKGVTHCRNVFTDGSKEAYDKVYRHTESAGYSNVFLVKGKNFEQALLGTDGVLFDFHLASPVYISEDTECWLFVSLGLGLPSKSGRDVGPAHLDRRDRVITFEYEPDVDDISAHGGADRGYAYWVPLGRLEKGEYTLNLLPKAGKRPTLSRVVTLREK